MIRELRFDIFEAEFHIPQTRARPELILCNLYRPGRSGPAIKRRLEQQTQNRRFSFIFPTAAEPPLSDRPASG